jgi:surfactin synthase thioesterase subunit
MYSDLVCFPFAGGGKYCYNALKDMAGDKINFIACELPGRGERSMEKLLTDMGSMVGDLVRQVQAKITGPYAIFGHSMGALLACLVAKEIKRRSLGGPDHLFLTGCGRPTKELHRDQFHKLPKAEFIRIVKDLGGMQSELLENEEFFSFYEPILRADFQAIETYEWRYSEPLDIDISVVVGTEDKVTREEAMRWQEETTGEVTVERLAGDHFFIFNESCRFIDMISEKMYVNSKAQQSENSHRFNSD